MNRLRVGKSIIFLISGLITLLAHSNVFAAATLEVKVQDAAGNPMPSVYVLAVQFSQQGIGTDSVTGWTASTGSVTFTLTDSFISYHIFATTQAYGPTLREQIFNPEHPQFVANGQSDTRTITLGQALSNVALVRLNLTNGTANGLTCEGINFQGSREELSMSVTRLDGVGDGTAFLFNVPADATSRSYDSGSFDAGSNLHVGASTTTDIAPGAVLDFDLDFNDTNALPPDSVESQIDENSLDTGQGGGPGQGDGGIASVEGVVTSTDGVNFIPHVGIEVRQQGSNGGVFWAAWVNADQNGRFRIYGLTEGTTYFVRTFSGCTFGANPVCFKGWESPSISTGGIPALNDFLYTGGTLVKKIKLERAPPGSGKMEILVQDEQGRPIPGVWVNIWPDGGPWHYIPPPYPVDNVSPFGPGNEEIANNICDTDPSSSGFHYVAEVDRNEAGLTNFNGQATTGYVLVDNLLPGNYQVQVWTRFSNEGIMYNAGLDGLWDWNWGHRGCGPNTGQASQGQGEPGQGPSNSSDDLRITVSSNTNNRNTNVFVFTTSGTLKHADGSADGAYDDFSNAVNISSIVVTVKLKPKPAGARLITGTLNFPEVVDLRNEPITLIAQRQCQPSGGEGISGGGEDTTCWQDGGYAVVDGSGSSSYTYEIYVTSKPARYWFNIETSFWGVVREGGGNGDIDLQQVSTATLDFTFARAGRITGNVYKPDGSKFIPGQTQNGWLSGNVNANGDEVESWGWAQVQNDGSFVIGGLLPGKYRMDAQLWGDANALNGATFTLPEPRPEAAVTAQQTVAQDIKFITGEVVLVEASTEGFPVLKTLLEGDGHRGYAGEKWEIIRLPAGRLLDGGKIHDLLEEDHGEGGSSFGMTIVGNGTFCGPVTEIDRQQGLKWCPKRVPTGGVYDFYFMRRGRLDGIAGTSAQTYEYFTIYHSSKNVVVNAAHRSTNTVSLFGSPVKPVRVDVEPPLEPTEGVVAAGTVTANNMIRELDWKQMGGDFKNFLKFIPVVSIYDSTGTLIAAGMVTPPPNIVGNKEDGFDENCVPGVGPFQPMDFNKNCFDDLDEAFQSQDFARLQSLFTVMTASFGWQYEIRGIPPGQKVRAIITTPNYPPYSADLTLGNDGTTAVQDFNLDALVGSGASISGVVTSTAGTALANATVVIEGSGYSKRKTVTSSTGVYRFDGLPEGTFKVSVNAAGYLQGVKRQSVSGTSEFTVNFSLDLTGPGIIQGVVYSQRIPFARTQPGAKIFAYDDTYNAQNPTLPLPLMKTVTGSTGVYTLNGLIPDHVYKIFLVVPGKYVLNQSTTAINGVISGVDFDMLTRPLEIDIFGELRGQNYEFLIKNPDDFKEGNAWIGTAPLASTAAATDVSDSFIRLPNNNLGLKWPVSSMVAGQTYVLHIQATNLAGKTVVQEFEFGLGIGNRAALPVDVQILGDDSEDSTGRKNNQAAISQTAGGDPSGISFPVGAAQTSSTGAIPSVAIVSQSTASATAGASAMTKLTSLRGTFMGNLYDITLSSMNFTGKELTLTLAYSKEAVGGNLGSLQVRHYNIATDTWELVSGALSMDPTLGTVTVGINPNSAASGLYVQGGRYGAQSAGRSMAAVNDGKQFLSRGPLTHSAATGSFAVVSAASSTVAASGYRQYNFPNPFNLKSKTVTIRGGNPSSIGTNITGTYIVVAPTGSGTVNVKIRIYNLAGDLVREIDDTAEAGVYNYFHWDGHNKHGEEVASGVYFAVVDAPGSNKKKPIKMVVVK